MMDTLFCGNREPTLDQVLSEPIVQMMMRRDGVDETAMRRLMREVAARAKPPPKLNLIRPVPVEERPRPPSAGVIAARAAAARPAWPRVFPSL